MRRTSFSHVNLRWTASLALSRTSCAVRTVGCRAGAVEFAVAGCDMVRAALQCSTPALVTGRFRKATGNLSYPHLMIVSGRPIVHRADMH